MMFKYFAFHSPSGERFKLPLIPITICCNKQREDLYALVDSGSNGCVFSYSIAKLLDIDVYTGKEIGLSGFVGGEMRGHLHQVHIEIEGLPAFDTNVVFTENEQPVMPLLGQLGFFDNFQIRFERYKERMEIYPRSTSF